VVNGLPFDPTPSESNLGTIMTQQSKFFDAAHSTATLAQNLQKINQFADTMLDQLDKMVDAANQGQWDRVARTGELLALTSRAAGFRGVSALASAVKTEASKPYNDVEAKRSLIRLIGMCGRADSASLGGTEPQRPMAERRDVASLGGV
jgi:hypothetical protein